MKITLVVDGKTEIDEEDYGGYVFASITDTDNPDEVGVMTSIRAHERDAESLVKILVDKIIGSEESHKSMGVIH